MLSAITAGRHYFRSPGLRLAGDAFLDISAGGGSVGGRAGFDIGRRAWPWPGCRATWPSGVLMVMVHIAPAAFANDRRFAAPGHEKKGREIGQCQRARPAARIARTSGGQIPVPLSKRKFAKPDRFSPVRCTAGGVQAGDPTANPTFDRGKRARASRAVLAGFSNTNSDVLCAGVLKSPRPAGGQVLRNRRVDAGPARTTHQYSVFFAQAAAVRHRRRRRTARQKTLRVRKGQMGIMGWNGLSKQGRDAWAVDSRFIARPVLIGAMNGAKSARSRLRLYPAAIERPHMNCNPIPMERP